MTQTIVSKSNTPLQATGHQSCNAASSGVFDPRGSRQISMQAWLPGSLPAGINRVQLFCRTPPILFILLFSDDRFPDQIDRNDQDCQCHGDQ